MLPIVEDHYKVIDPFFKLGIKRFPPSSLFLGGSIPSPESRLAIYKYVILDITILQLCIRGIWALPSSLIARSLVLISTYLRTQDFDGFFFRPPTGTSPWTILVRRLLGMRTQRAPISVLSIGLPSPWLLVQNRQPDAPVQDCDMRCALRHAQEAVLEMLVPAPGQFLKMRLLVARRPGRRNDGQCGRFEMIQDLDRLQGFDDIDFLVQESCEVSLENRL